MTCGEEVIREEDVSLGMEVVGRRWAHGSHGPGDKMFPKEKMGFKV
jgi:hypothetical protein